jgi:peptidyl-prolyl cis-trans isomerase D
MLQFFRNMFKSKIGVGITLAFVGLIGLAFAVGDVASSGSFGGIAGGDSVAAVGGEKIGAADFSQAATNALERQRQQDPTASMASFAAAGGLDQLLDQMIDRRALSSWATANGLRAGDNLVNSEIRRIPAFAGLDGQFSDTVYRQALAQQKLTDGTVRRELADGLLAQQVLVPSAFGAKMGPKMTLRYAALTKERRTGALGLVPSSAFAPKGDPTPAQLSTYYEANKAQFIRPERRILRYLTFGEAAVGNVTPTDAEIAARYKANAATQYAGKEERALTQLIVPTRQAAEAIAARGSGALDAAAKAAGLETAKIAAVDRKTLASQASQGVADAVFSRGQGLHRRTGPR